MSPPYNKNKHAGRRAFAARSTPLALAGREGENAIYSPLSLWSALAMLAQCAGGESRQQVLDALGADSVDTLRQQAELVWRSLYTDDGLSALILANSVWLNSALEGAYVQDTLDTLAKAYYAGGQGHCCGRRQLLCALYGQMRGQNGVDLPAGISGTGAGTCLSGSLWVCFRRAVYLCDR